MYAVIKAGAHQYKVAEGETLIVDKVIGQSGDKVTFDQVLLLGGKQAQVGTPYIPGAKVEAVIKEQKRNPKIVVFKYKRRKNYKKQMGHKQPVTVVEISKIKV